MPGMQQADRMLGMICPARSGPIRTQSTTGWRTRRRSLPGTTCPPCNKPTRMPATPPAMAILDVQTSADNPGRPPETPRGRWRAVHAADLFRPGGEAAARQQLRRGAGDATGAIMIDQLEPLTGDHEAMRGTRSLVRRRDHRVWIKTEGEGCRREIEDAELQLP